MSGSPHGVFGGVKPFWMREAMNAFALAQPGVASTRARRSLPPDWPSTDADMMNAAAPPANRAANKGRANTLYIAALRRGTCIYRVPLVDSFLSAARPADSRFAIP